MAGEYSNSHLSSNTDKKLHFYLPNLYALLEQKTLAKLRSSLDHIQIAYNKPFILRPFALRLAQFAYSQTQNSLRAIIFTEL